MDLKEMYDEIGGNYNEAKSRLMNDALIEKFVLKYEADGTFEELKQAVSENDIEKSFRAAHTLKGVAANLSFNELAKAASALTEQLRPLKEVADTDLYAKVIWRQEKVIKGIETFKQSR